MDELEFRFDLQRFADGSTGGTGGEPSGTPAPGAGGQTPGQQTGGVGGDDDGKKIEFTPEQQAHIDQLISQRLKRAESAAAKKALEARAKELGFDSVQAMEEALAAHKKRLDDEKTAQQKAEEAKAAAEAQAKSAQEQAKRALIQAALMTAAAQAGFADPQDAVRMADASEIEVKDDGAVVGAKEAVEALAKAKPYLLRQGGSGAGGTGGNPPRGGPQADDAVERAKAEAARRNAGHNTPVGFDPWGSSGGQQNVEQIAQTVATAVAAALQGLQGPKG